MNILDTQYLIQLIDGTVSDASSITPNPQLTVSCQVLLVELKNRLVCEFGTNNRDVDFEYVERLIGEINDESDEFDVQTIETVLCEVNGMFS